MGTGDLEAKVVCVFLVRAQRVRKIVPRIPESQLQAQAFGSVDQTDDRRKLSMQSISAASLQVPMDNYNILIDWIY